MPSAKGGITLRKIFTVFKADYGHIHKHKKDGDWEKDQNQWVGDRSHEPSSVGFLAHKLRMSLKN